MKDLIELRARKYEKTMTKPRGAPGARKVEPLSTDRDSDNEGDGQDKQPREAEAGPEPHSQVADVDDPTSGEILGDAVADPDEEGAATGGVRDVNLRGWLQSLVRDGLRLYVGDSAK